MGTDVSDFSKKYSKKGEMADSNLVMPGSVSITLRGFPNGLHGGWGVEYNFRPVPVETRYGTNPHQQFAFYKPQGMKTHLGDMEVHKLGKEGFSKTNLQDMSQAISMLKYLDETGCVILKHLMPCGFSYGTKAVEAYEKALAGDPIAAFGGTVGFNTIVDEEAAEKIMRLFTENVVALGYTEGALQALRQNEGTKKLNHAVRVVSVADMCTLPRFWGDDVKNYLTIQTLPTGELTVEIPYLSGVRSVEDFIIDPEVAGVAAQRAPTSQELTDALLSWRLVAQTRSNAVIAVRGGRTIGIGEGQPDRVGAVEQAIDKARRFGFNLEGAVLASDAFFPKRDSIDYAGRAGVKAIVWPAGSKGDKEIIAAANEYGMAMMVPKTGERCFLHV